MKTKPEAHTHRLTNYQLDVLDQGMSSVARIYSDEPLIFEFIQQAVYSYDKNQETIWELAKVLKTMVSYYNDEINLNGTHIKVMLAEALARAEGGQK